MSGIRTILLGEGAPYPALGMNDDLYLDTESGLLYGKDDVWEFVASLKGDDGLNGRDGKDGEDGRNGVRGADGKDGRDGTDGKDGVDGLNGVDGKDGADGVDGKEVELRARGNLIEWHYKGDKNWKELFIMPISTGGSGAALKVLRAEYYTKAEIDAMLSGVVDMGDPT